MDAPIFAHSHDGLILPTYYSLHLHCVASSCHPTEERKPQTGMERHESTVAPEGEVVEAVDDDKGQMGEKGYEQGNKGPGGGEG